MSEDFDTPRAKPAVQPAVIDELTLSWDGDHYRAATADGASVPFDVYIVIERDEDGKPVKAKISLRMSNGRNYFVGDAQIPLEAILAQILPYPTPNTYVDKEEKQTFAGGRAACGDLFG